MERLVSSQSIKSEFLSTSIALNVISFRFPIGVDTTYRQFFNKFML